MTINYKSPEHFIFECPLYDLLAISEEQVRTILVEEVRIDGYCPHCRQMRTFNRIHGQKTYNWLELYDHEDDENFGELRFVCTRYEAHVLRFIYFLARGTIQKIGQFPSFADIALDESKEYSKLLSKEDASEFHKAIGLAAHGVGIGSYVYIRRIFERLIQKRFDEFQSAEGWDAVEYQKMKMAERIEFMKSHLPEFLVKNKRIYSILSLGVHELDEQTCLGFFDVLKTSTIIILEEDKKKREELKRQEALQKAIASFEKPSESAAIGPAASEGRTGDA